MESSDKLDESKDCESDSVDKPCVTVKNATETTSKSKSLSTVTCPKKSKAIVKITKCDHKLLSSNKSKSPSKSTGTDKGTKDGIVDDKKEPSKNKVKTPVKKTAKRKSDSISTDKKDDAAPKPKQPKKIIKVALGRKPIKAVSKESGNDILPKPKRKYVRKNKASQKTDTETKVSAESSSAAQQEVHDVSEPADMQREATAPRAEAPHLKLRKKPGPKKGSKRKPKMVAADVSTSKQHESTLKQHATSTTSTTSNKDLPGHATRAVDNEADSDTVDYSTSLGTKSHTSPAAAVAETETAPVAKAAIGTGAAMGADAAMGTTSMDTGVATAAAIGTGSKIGTGTAAETSQANVHNVVKIDDIEITELSDLNSSREESGEECEAGRSVEQPQVPVPTFINMDDCEQADKTYVCSYPSCKYHGKNRVGLRKHLSHHHIYLCAHCEFHCNVNSELDMHMVANHPQRWGRKKCKKCQRYIRGDIFDSHELICDGTTQFICEQCNKVFKYESKLHDHEKKFHAHIKCEQCDFVAENKSNLNDHIKSVHPKPKKPRTKKKPKEEQASTLDTMQSGTLEPVFAPHSVVPNSIEEDCRKVIVQPAASPVGTVLMSPLEDTPEKVPLSHAISNIDTIDNSQLDSITPIPVPIIKQDSMQIISDSSGQVTLSIPDSSVPDILSSNFLMSPDSTTPMLCPPGFKAPQSHVCDIDGCGRVLKTYRLLVNHKKTVHKIFPSEQTYPCDHPDCNYVFKKKGQLKKHQVVHTGERRYICSYEGCGKAFRHNANLKIHNLLHTGEKPIKCMLCEFSCRQKSSLLHHMKTKHKDENFTLKSQSSVENADDALMQDGVMNEVTAVVKENIMNKSSSGDESGGTEQPSDADTSFNSATTEPELTTSENLVTSSFTPPVTHAPIPLQTPTKAMVKAMTPGFLLAAGGAPAPVSLSQTKPRTQLDSQKSDVYDFDEDDCEPHKQEVTKPPPKKAPAKTKVEVKPETSGESNASAPVKKKRGPKKKEDSANKAKAPKAAKTASPKKKKNINPSETETVELAAKSPVSSTDVPAEMVGTNATTDVKTNVKSDEKTGVKSDEKTDVKNDEKTDVKSDEKTDVKSDEKTDVKTDVKTDLPTDVKTNETVEATQNLQEVKLFHSQRTASPGPPSPPVEEPLHAAFDDDMGPPHAPAPAYSHHDSPLSALDEDNSNDARVQAAAVKMPEIEAAKLPATHDAAIAVSQAGSLKPESVVNEASVTSQNSPVKESVSMEQQAASVLDMNIAGGHTIVHDPLSVDRKPDSSYFDLEHDIDPDEAAKILEESDEREKREQKEKEERMRRMSDDIAKDSYRYMTSPAHVVADSLRRSSSDMYPDYRQHSTDFSHIQGLDSSLKDPASVVSAYGSAMQRRPSGSYVPEFLGNLATTSAGPPSVSSNYSTHSNPMTQPPTNLASFGASAAAGLPSYPPVSSFMTPVATSTSPVTSTSHTDTHADRYRLHDTSTATTTTSSLPSSAYPPRDLFPHYFQDPSLSLPPIGSQQDPRTLAYAGQESSLQALQRSSADFLQRASATNLAGMSYPSVTESLARLSQTSGQQPWMGHDDRTRSWPQSSPMLPQELDGASSLNRHPFSTARPELSSLEAASKRADAAFPGVTQPTAAAPDRYDVASAYMGGAPFNPAAAAASANYSKSLAPSVNPQKHLEEAYRQSALSDYRSLSHAAPMTDVYSRMAMNPALGLDKYYPYSRAAEGLYRAPQLGANPFMPSTSSAPQMPYAERDYARNPYAQDSAYGKYLPGSNLTQPLPPALQGAASADYFPPRPGGPESYIADPYRRTVIHNMMTRFY